MDDDDDYVLEEKDDEFDDDYKGGLDSDSREFLEKD